MDLGIYGLTLPFENGDQALFDVLQLKTLNVFSIFLPQIIKLTLNVNQLKCIKNNFNESIFEIPDIFGERNIMYIKKVEPKNKLIGDGYVNPMFNGSIELYNEMMNVQSDANLMSAVAPAFTFKFENPNILYLYNMVTTYGEFDIEFAIEHAENLSTIKPTTFLSFYELALLDVKMFLYNNLKHYTEIQTAYGTINLKIDDWSNAENDRKDLIEKWKDLFHLEIQAFNII
jgi:hypothetical protein